MRRHIHLLAAHTYPVVKGHTWGQSGDRHVHYTSVTHDDQKTWVGGGRRAWATEEVDLSDYEDYDDVVRQLGRFLDEVYVHKRIHSSVGYLTPAEFESQWLAERSSEQVVHQEPAQMYPTFGVQCTIGSPRTREAKRRQPAIPADSDMR